MRITQILRFAWNDGSFVILRSASDEGSLKQEILRFAQDDKVKEILRFAQDDTAKEILRFAQDDTAKEILRCAQDDRVNQKYYRLYGRGFMTAEEVIPLPRRQA